jgi:hypothetical protein
MYHFVADDRGVQQAISLGNTEVYESSEHDCLSPIQSHALRRDIFKKFNANIMIKSDNRNNTNFTVSLSRVS